MPKNKKIIRQVQFEQTDWEILKRYAEDKALGGKWLSSATRGIIRDWQKSQDNQKETQPSG